MSTPSTVYSSGQVDSGHLSFNHVVARCGSVQGWSKAHPEPFHICYAPDPGGETLLRRSLRQATCSRFLIVGPKALQTETAFRQRGTFVCPACGRSSAPAAPALRLVPGRALRARPRSGRGCGQGMRNCAGSLHLSLRYNGCIIPLYSLCNRIGTTVPSIGGCI